MRAGLLLPASIVLSAVVHVLLVAAVAVPRPTVTSHGETITVDIVPANEVPDLPEPPPETAPSVDMPSPSPAEDANQSAAQEPAPQAAPRQQPQQQQPQQQQRQQAQRRPTEQQQSSQQQQQQQQSPPPQHQAEKPWPEQPAPPASVPGSSLAEQHERLTAMLNLAGPGAGDGSGAEADTSARLSPQEIAAFRAHLKSCWRLPQGVSPSQHLKVIMRVSLHQNGTLSTDPALIEAGISPIGPPLVQAAVKALTQCQPYSMLPPAKYKEWRILDINFSPDEMAKG